MKPTITIPTQPALCTSCIQEMLADVPQASPGGQVWRHCPHHDTLVSALVGWPNEETLRLISWSWYAPVSADQAAAMVRAITYMPAGTRPSPTLQ